MAAILCCATSCTSSDYERLYPICDTQGKRFGFIDKDGKVVVETTYDGAYNFSEGLGRVKQDGKWGFVDAMGKMVISPQLDYCSDFHEGLCAVGFKDGKWGSKWGYINRKGVITILPVYKSAYDFRDGLALVERDSSFFISKDGKYVISNNTDSWNYFGNGLCRYEESGKYGYRNKKGEVVIEAAFDDAIPFQYGLAVVSLTYKNSGVIDAKGNWVVKPENSEDGMINRIIVLNEDRIAIKREGKWGIVNRKGETVADFLFDGIFLDCRLYHGAIHDSNVFPVDKHTPIPAKLGNKWGYIDLNGKFVINPIYERAMPFRGELAVVFTEVKDDYYAKGGYVNKDGKMVYAINLKN